MTIENEDVLTLTARAIATWLDGHVELIYGLAALGSLGTQAERAIEAVLAVRDLRVLRASYELFELLATDRGADARSLLRAAGSEHEHVLDGVLGRAAYADPR